MFRFRHLSFTTIALWLLATTVTAQLQEFRKLCDVKDFDDFLQQTGKVYEDEKERSFRESLFRATKTVVDLSNKGASNGLSGFRLELNPLADFTKQEISKLTGSRVTPPGEFIGSQHVNFITATRRNPNLPESFDWRLKGGVTPPKFQGFTCGSCWCFSAIGALEGHIFRRTGFLVPLSEQNLLDCGSSYGAMGCDGGFQEYGFEYIREHGVSVEKKYPYTQMDGQCHRNDSDNGVQIRDYATIKPGDEQQMKEVIATLGPLACTLNGSPISFLQYVGGIYDDDECNQEDVNHSIVVVGYGSEGGRDYWIVKNSYSENWGENGFMKLLRNQNSFCGIANECSYPVL